MLNAENTVQAINSRDVSIIRNWKTGILDWTKVELDEMDKNRGKYYKGGNYGGNRCPPKSVHLN